ncbi:MAG: GvpL/GvpF family gas vesicle protein [Chloroflexota bacterium]
MKRMGKYLYAIVGGSGDRSYGPIGINGSVVHTLSNGSVAAVVSDMMDKRIRPERKNLAAHHAVGNG